MWKIIPRALIKEDIALQGMMCYRSLIAYPAGSILYARSPYEADDLIHHWFNL